ncbi:hypothetical protein K3495_g13950 [Podosphaera aphanis]|nr:hypothetical protein K3495_g13950 [Podosphaera aphanis]
MKGKHPIKQIENLLKNEILSRGNILIHRWEFTDIDSLVKRFYKTREPDVIIFANGAKTTMREKYFGGSDEAMQFANAMSVHYSRAPGLNSPGLSYADTYRISKLIGTQLFQAQKDHVNVRLIMIGPFTQPEFHQKMNAVINARRIELGERLTSQPTTSFFSLRVEIAREVQSRYGNVHLYLIGDAAAILPYQLGLNTGFSSVEILVTNPRNYGNLASDLFKKKKSLANWKYLISEHFREFMKTSSSTPWEFVRWSANYNRLLLTTSDITSNYVLQHQYTQQRKLPIQRAAERNRRKIKTGT